MCQVLPRLQGSAHQPGDLWRNTGEVPNISHRNRQATAEDQDAEKGAFYLG